MENGPDGQALGPPAELPRNCRMRGALTANHSRRQQRNAHMRARGPETGSSASEKPELHQIGALVKTCNQGARRGAESITVPSRVASRNSCSPTTWSTSGAIWAIGVRM